MQQLPLIDPSFMDRAISLAALGSRHAMPNPCVGAVIEHKNSIIAEGYHKRFGGPHAEVNAIDAVAHREVLRHSTLYVTLEPCSHHGKTPPCADLILASRIPRVVVGCRDPFAAAAGRGIEKLIEAGVEVIEGIRHDECTLMNRRFILAHRLHRPYIILKWAQTSDEFIAPEGGARTQISCHESQLLVHHWRGQEMAIAVGATTAVSDNPTLKVRHTDLFAAHELPAQQPVKVVIGDSARLDPTLNLWHGEARALGFSPSAKAPKQIGSAGSIFKVAGSKALLPQICKILFENSITSMLVEGGTKTLESFIDTDLWDEARVFTAPIHFTRGVKAPNLSLSPRSCIASGVDTLRVYNHPDLEERLGLHE
jgi:diaminohydroxyphosphoribosylaminopyrimidine deaminase/5-amino-6-(5-phosphoribosylamino)uracil reductase